MMLSKEEVVKDAIKLIAELVDNGYTKYRIAKETDIAEKTIGNYVNKINKPSFRNAKVLLDYYKGSKLNSVPSNLNNSFVGDGNKNINFGHGLKNVHFGHEPETTQAIQSDRDVITALEKKILFLEGELKSRDKEIEGIKNALTDKERLVQVLMNNLTDKNL